MMHGIGSLNWTINQLNAHNTQQSYPPIICDLVGCTNSSRSDYGEDERFFESFRRAEKERVQKRYDENHNYQLSEKEIDGILKLCSNKS